MLSAKGSSKTASVWSDSLELLLGTVYLPLIPIDHLVEIPFSFQADKKDSQGNNTVSGFEILLQKQLKGKQMQKEMAEFVRER